MSRSVRVETCPTCKAKILRGLNRDVLAFDTNLDHDPVDNFGEALAVLTGRITYDLRPVGGRSHGRVMEERNAFRIRSDMQMWPVHAEHRCGQPLPAAPPKPAQLDQPLPETTTGLPF